MDGLFGELAIRLLYIGRPGAGIRRLFTPRREVGGLVEIAGGEIRIGRGPGELEIGCRLFGEILFPRHKYNPVTTVTPSPHTRDGGIRSGQKHKTIRKNRGGSWAPQRRREPAGDPGGATSVWLGVLRQRQARRVDGTRATRRAPAQISSAWPSTQRCARMMAAASSSHSMTSGTKAILPEMSSL